MKIKKGDTVKILYGKDNGKSGRVVAVDLEKRLVVVEGLNIYKRHLKGDGKKRTSEILSIEKPLPVSKVMLLCPMCNKATRVGLRREEKNVVRICKKCGKDIEVKKVEKEEVKKEPVKEKKAKKVVKKVTKKTIKK